MEDLKKVKKIIEETQNISLLSSPEFRKDSFPAVLGLFYSLKKLGKNVNLFAENYPERYSFLVRKEKFYPPRANFLISIKEAEAKLSHLFYEKTDQGLNLFLKTKGGELKKEDFSFRSLDFGDFLITVGIENLKKVEQFFKTKPKLIINIDNGPENENYGQINLVELGSTTLSEIVCDSLSLFSEELFDREVANALLSGIIQESLNFQNHKLKPQTFQKISFLIEKGADFKETISHLYGVATESSLKIFGKVLSKINFFPEQNLSWILLSKEDFSQTESTPSNLRFTLEKLSSGLFPVQNFLLLWEAELSPISIKGVFYSLNKSRVEKILTNFEGRQKGNGVLFQTEENDIKKVKDKILKILS